MHTLPQLRKMERKYADVLTVIGVHSAKFMAERAEIGLRNAVRRYEVEHPVVNDADFRVWQEYAVRAWPTLYFVDPKGRIVARHEGELSSEELDRLLSAMVEEYDREGLLVRRRLDFQPERRPEGTLAYPGKVLADEASARLFIADSGHNRVLEAGLDGRVSRVWGRGEAGLADGEAESAAFDHPQGVALQDDQLFVADTENHAIRRLDLGTGRVVTVAGTGEQAHGYAREGARGREAALSSPWDLCVLENVLYIAMAGMHQLWALELSSGLIRPCAGSGVEGLEDGPASRAQLAQPSGLTTDGVLIYFADSETSSVRTFDPASGKVETLVGVGLFEFGDEDGVGEQVRLQHPLGVCWLDGLVYVADTYNSKVKRLDPDTRRCASWLGSGRAGFGDGTGSAVQFSEPGGLSAVRGRVFIADTNNHAIRVAEVSSGRVSTLELAGA